MTDTPKARPESRPARRRGGLVPAALLLALSATGCRGVSGDAGLREADWAPPDVPVLLVSAHEEPEPVTHTSPLSAILSRILPGRDADDRRRRRVRVEPVPIVTDHERGFGVTLHW